MDFDSIDEELSLETIMEHANIDNVLPVSGHFECLDASPIE